MANAILYSPVVTYSFRDSGGDAVLSLLNLATVTGRLSARLDRGTGSKPGWAMVRGVFQWETAPVVGVVARVYIVTSDGTYADGAVGTADAALTTAQISNLGNPVLLVAAQTTATATNNIGSAWIWIPTRYFSIGVYNAAAVALENTANACRVEVAFYSAEVQ